MTIRAIPFDEAARKLSDDKLRELASHPVIIISAIARAEISRRATKEEKA